MAPRVCRLHSFTFFESLCSGSYSNTHSLWQYFLVVFVAVLIVLQYVMCSHFNMPSYSRDVYGKLRIGKAGIPWVLLDSHGNGNMISHGMGMGIRCIGMGIKTLQWENVKFNML